MEILAEIYSPFNSPVYFFQDRSSGANKRAEQAFPLLKTKDKRAPGEDLSTPILGATRSSEKQVIIGAAERLEIMMFWGPYLSAAPGLSAI